MVNIKRSKLKELAKIRFGSDTVENQTKVAIMLGVVQAARVSYTVVGEEGKAPNYENDIKLYDKLLESKHLSPFEHCAKVMTDDEYNSRLFIGNNGQHGWCKNFRGFIQQRYFIE